MYITKLLVLLVLRYTRDLQTLPSKNSVTQMQIVKDDLYESVQFQTY